jgi:Ca-activated chloride channel family protein
LEFCNRLNSELFHSITLESQKPVIDFVHPTWLLAGLLLILGLIFSQPVIRRRRQARLERFAGAPLIGRLTENLSLRRRRLKWGLWLAALFCCFVALARPQVGFQMVDVKRRGIDILFALDTSKSMLSQDIRPNRLERAKLAIMDFTQQLEGDRVGLLPFAGTAFLMCPLTIDYSAFESTLRAVNSSIIPRGGTNLAEAINLAASSLAGTGNHKILILLTDGESLEGDALAAATKAGQKGMTIFTVGVGTPEGELIPQPEKGAGHFVKDDAGKYVTAKLDEQTLTAIAGAAGGLYVPLGKNGEGLEQIYQQKLRLIPKQELMERQRRQPLERFSWPLGAAILLLAVEFMISGRKSAQALHSSLVKTAGRRIRQGITTRTLLLCLLLSLAGFDRAQASTGEKAFAAGDYLGAAQWYDQALQKNPDDPRLHYNSGTAAYKNNLLDQAIGSFRQALKSEDLGLQEQTYYNLGNALAKKGEELAQSDPGQTEKLWEQARDAYSGSLSLNPEARDSRDNRDLLTRRLEELKEQLRKQERDKQQKDKQQDKQQDTQEEKGGEEQQKSGDQGADQQKDQGKDQGDTGQPGQADKQENGEGQPGKDDLSPRPDPSSQPGNKSDDPADKAKEASADQAAGDEQPARPPESAPGADSGGDDQAREKSASTPAAPAAQVGRMSEGEARQLLSRLKEEEGRLNLVPRRDQGKAEKEGTWKDW